MTDDILFFFSGSICDFLAGKVKIFLFSLVFHVLLIILLQIVDVLEFMPSHVAVALLFPSKPYLIMLLQTIIDYLGSLHKSLFVSS